MCSDRLDPCRLHTDPANGRAGRSREPRASRWGPSRPLQSHRLLLPSDPPANPGPGGFCEMGVVAPLGGAARPPCEPVRASG